MTITMNNIEFGQASWGGDRVLLSNSIEFMKKCLGMLILRVKNENFPDLENVDLNIKLKQNSLMISCDLSNSKNEYQAYYKIYIVKLLLTQLNCSYFDIEKDESKFVLEINSSDIPVLLFFFYAKTTKTWQSALTQLYKTASISLESVNFCDPTDDPIESLEIIFNEKQVSNSFQEIGSVEVSSKNILYSIALVSDMTYSMDKEIEVAKTLFSGLVNELPKRIVNSENSINFCFSGVAYGDYQSTDETYTGKNDRFFKDNTEVCKSIDFSNNAADIDRFFSDIKTLTYGVDAQEAVELGLYRTRNLTWPQKTEMLSVIKNIFIVIDTPAHAFGSAVGDRFPKKYSNPAKLHYADEIDEIAKKGIKIYPVLKDNYAPSVEMAKEMAEKTGGMVVDLSSGFEKLIEYILQSIDADLKENAIIQKAARALIKSGRPVTAEALSDALSKNSDFLIHDNSRRAISVGNVVSAKASSQPGMVASFAAEKAADNYVKNNTTSSAGMVAEGGSKAVVSTKQRATLRFSSLVADPMARETSVAKSSSDVGLIASASMSVPLNQRSVGTASIIYNNGVKPTVFSSAIGARAHGAGVTKSDDSLKRDEEKRGIAPPSSNPYAMFDNAPPAKSAAIGVKPKIS